MFKNFFYYIFRHKDYMESRKLMDTLSEKEVDISCFSLCGSCNYDYSCTVGEQFALKCKHRITREMIKWPK
jgi:hypothetical protein